MINVAGFKVFPREVEEMLFEHPAVAEVAVLGRPDAVKGRWWWSVPAWFFGPGSRRGRRSSSSGAEDA